MRMQIITITPAGGLFGLAHKTGFQPHVLGRTETRRVSDIQWDPDAEAWYVLWLRGPHAGEKMGLQFVEDYFLCLSASSCKTNQDGVLFFASYDAAVGAEVAVIESAQKRGDLWV